MASDLGWLRITGLQDNIGRTVGYQYDGSARLWKVTDPENGVTEYSYDASHRMLTMRSPRFYTDTTTTPTPVVSNHYDG